MRAVLDAVVDLVAESGMAALTMDAVAARAGVSKPAMYRRWSTRQDLVLAAAESRIGPRTVPGMGDFRAGPRAVLTARTKACRQPGSDRLPARVRVPPPRRERSAAPAVLRHQPHRTHDDGRLTAHATDPRASRLPGIVASALSG
ncbi:helix-turn-helix domain-containing protein [Streptomyces sp. NPDC056982]|uniref:helix-turn-helix domain-containing protein n=1 Tax=Streptomyces sp. NPDC056982 TaxID=3345986 RepID=UPI00363D5B3C